MWQQVLMNLALYYVAPEVVRLLVAMLRSLTANLEAQGVDSHNRRRVLEFVRSRVREHDRQGGLNVTKRTAVHAEIAKFIVSIGGTPGDAEINTLIELAYQELKAEKRVA